MARVEEARRPVLGRRAAREVRLGRLHLVPRLGERSGDARDVLGRAGPVERVVGPLVRLHRAEVGRLRLRVGLDLLVQADDVIGERDEILSCERLDLGELPFALTPPPEDAEPEEGRDGGADDQEPGREPTAVLLAGRLGRSRTGLAYPAHEVGQDRSDSLLAAGAECAGREVGGLRRRGIVADRAELVADDDGIDALLTETASELERNLRGRADLAAGRRRKDRNEDRRGAALVDLGAQPVRFGPA